MIWKRSIEEYTRELDLYTKSIQNRTDDESDDECDIEEIFYLIEELYNLPINGSSIKDQIDKIRQDQVVCIKAEEKIIDLPNGANLTKALSDLKALLNSNVMKRGHDTQ